MNIADLIKDTQIAKKKRVEKQKNKALQNNADLMDVYAENVLNKLKAEYNQRLQKGKTSCKIHFNPYPNAEIMRKIFKKVSRKEYLAQFKEKLSVRLEKENFLSYSFSSSIINQKEPVILIVKW